MPPENRITNACTVKLSGNPVRADKPRVKVAAVTTREMVNAPTVAIRNIRSTKVTPDALRMHAGNGGDNPGQAQSFVFTHMEVVGHG